MRLVTRIEASRQVLIGTLASVLLASGFLHLGSPYSFVGSVHAYGLTSQDVSVFIAFVLPMFQVVVAAGLFFRGSQIAAAILSTLLFSCFCAAQSIALVSGKEIGCGCFGKFSVTISPATVSTSLMLALLSLCFLVISVDWKNRETF